MKLTGTTAQASNKKRITMQLDERETMRIQSQTRKNNKNTNRLCGSGLNDLYSQDNSQSLLMITRDYNYTIITQENSK